MTAVSHSSEVTAYEFGKFRLVSGERMLLRGGVPVSLPPKVFDALVLLVENHGHLIGKNEMLDALWPEAFVEEATLARTISSLRKALGETDESKFVETVSKRGYRFIAPIRQLDGTDNATSPDITKPEAPNEIVATESKPSLWSWIVSRPVLSVCLLGFAILSAGLIVSWNRQPASANEMKSIAVLPFNRIGDGERDETLEFGMADTLVTRLSGLRRVIVRPTSAVVKYAGQERETAAVGRDLQVDAVLESSIQKSGERVRVNVRLINVSDGKTLWAEKFDTAFTDIFTVQDSISEQVVSALLPQLSKSAGLISRRPTDNADAYRLYLQGRYFWNKRTEKDLYKAVEFFQQATEKDPQYALAYTGLADCYQLLSEYLAIPPSEAFAKARTAANKALEIDDQLAEAHTSLAYTLAFYDWNWAGAEAGFKRAIELDPNYATAHQWYGEYLLMLGRFDEAKAANEEALRLNPTSLIIQTDLAAFYYTTRNFDESIRWSNLVIEADSTFAYGYVFLCLSYGQKGMKQEAAEAYAKSVEMFGDPPSAVELRSVLEKGGIKAFWMKRIEQVEPAKSPYFSPLWRAFHYSWVDDRENAMYWLEKSFEMRERWVGLTKILPSLIRSDRIRASRKSSDVSGSDARTATRGSHVEKLSC